MVKSASILQRNQPDLDLSQFLSLHEGRVLCPACLFEYTHLARLEIDQGGDVVEVDRHGPGFLRREPSARWSVINIDFFCEAGHEFRVSFQFHKGNTFFWARVVGESQKNEDVCPSFPLELWRE